MSDSEMDEELFGDNGRPGNVGLGGELLQDDSDDKSSSMQYLTPPDYVSTIEFKRFTKQSNVVVDSRYGYMSTFLARPFYFPGQTVRGFAILDIFNDLPSREIMIRVKGREVPGKFGKKINRKLREHPDQFHYQGFNDRQKKTQYMSVASSMSQKGPNNAGMSGSNYNAANEQGAIRIATLEDDRLSMNASKIGDLRIKGDIEKAMLPPAPMTHQSKEGLLQMKYFQAQENSQTTLMKQTPKLYKLEIERIPTETITIERADHSQIPRPISAACRENIDDHKTSSSHQIEMVNLNDSITQPPKLNQVISQKQPRLIENPTHNRAQTMIIEEKIKPNPEKLMSNISLFPQPIQTPKQGKLLHPNQIQKRQTGPSPHQASLLNVDELVSSALTLSKKQVSKKEEEAIAKKSIPLLDYKVMAFQFRDKEMPRGQYRLPFSFRLPQNIPGTFKYQRERDIQKGEEENGRITIEYTIEVYMDVLPKDQDGFRMSHKLEIDVREFLFTDQEIQEDWLKYQQIIDLKKILRPNTIFDQRSLDKFKLTELNQEDSFRDNNESLSKIVKYNNHYGEDTKMAEKNTMQFGSLREKLNDLMTNQQQGIVNPSWNFDQLISSSKCLCFKSSYIMQIVAQLNKQLFYPDEQVIVDFSVDNSRSERDIKEIRCSLQHTISIKQAEESLQTIHYSLGMHEFKGVQKKKIQERQEFIFDLQHILTEFKQLHDYHKTARRMSSESVKNKLFSTAQSDLGASGNITTDLKSQINSQSYRAFQKQRVKMLDDLDQLTLLTVHGLSVKSDFSVELSIIVSDMLGETKHSQSFPFTIRSRKNGDFINDLDSLGAQPIMSNVNNIMEKLQVFINEPFSLPGCNFHAKLEY